MKRIVKAVILGITLLLCICVFPLCLIRKEENLDPALGLEYASAKVRELKQNFTAQTEYLDGIAFDIGMPEEGWGEGSLFVRIQEEGGKERVSAEKEIPWEEVNDAAFTYVPIKGWLKKGAGYSVVIGMEEGAEGAFEVMYTLKEEDAAPGSGRMYFAEESAEGQAVIRYVYGFPLNMKNTVCLWAFFWVIGLTVLELVSGKRLLADNSFFAKAEALLTKWQIPILLGELAVIMALIVRICRNEAVHWDEAFTWQLVTKNNLSEMLKATAADVHPPLYYMLVMAAMKVFGQNIFVGKMVSAAAAAATGMLGITLVRKRWGVKAAALFLPAAGLGPQLIFHNVDLRMYSWLIFFVTAAGLSAYEIMLSGRRRWWAAFTLAALGGVYTQYFSVVPLALLYVFLLVWILAKDRGQIKKWLCCCAVTVAGYLPWLTVVVDTLQRDAGGGREEVEFPGIGELFEWAFQSNIKWSESMPVILLIAAVLCVIVERKRYTSKEKVFLALSGAMLFGTYGLCMFLASKMSHFWDNRYLVDALLFLWLFLFIALAGRSLITWGMGMVWLGILMLSSYTVMQAVELNTVPWTAQARQVLEQIQDEERIVYNFPTFDVLYEYYLPNAEFVWYEDVDFEQWENGEFYVLASGGNDFWWQLYVDGVLKKEVLGSMRLEESIVVELWKISYQE